MDAAGAGGAKNRDPRVILDGILESIRLIRGYYAVGLDLVWQVVIKDAPALESQLRAI